MCFGRTLSTLPLVGMISMLGGCKKDDDIRYPPGPPANFAPADAGPAVSPTDAAPEADAADAAPPALDSVSQQTLGFAVEKRAAKDARGMNPLGELFGARLAEGQQVHTEIMIDSGKCYGVVAVGEPSVLEVDIQIVNPALAVPGAGTGHVIAVDNTTGSEAVVSPCWKNVFPVGFPARVVLMARRGSGSVAARVYVK